MSAVLRPLHLPRGFLRATERKPRLLTGGQEPGAGQDRLSKCGHTEV